jgi:hypothetical protein
MTEQETISRQMNSEDPHHPLPMGEGFWTAGLNQNSAAAPGGDGFQRFTERAKPMRLPEF